MYTRWNDEHLHTCYERVLWRAKDFGFIDEELERPEISAMLNSTKSAKKRDAIRLAFFLGQLRGVRDADELLTGTAVQ